jgi:hypothetical protein
MTPVGSCFARGAEVVWSVLAALSLAAGAFPAAVILLFAVGLTPRPDPRAA